MANVISWFEIPAKNFSRACKFYGKVLGGEIHGIEMAPGLMMGMLPGTTPDAVGGAVVSGPGFEPSERGSLVYLNGGEDLNLPLGRVVEAGGKVVMSKTAIPENGFMAQFMDSEGNRVALHSMA